MRKLEIPIWEKAIITVEEASAIAGGLNEAIIRLHAAQAINYGRITFECYMTGNKLCIVKDSFLKWLSELGRRHEQFCIIDCQRQLKELNALTETEKEAAAVAAAAKRGRPRKMRGIAI